MRGEASILHVDLDAFFAAVEVLDDPSLRGRPVIVGGLGPRGVVSTASYEARKYGIHSAMPMARARRLAPPDAAFLPPRFAAYTAASAHVMTILRDATPLVEPLSIDEAFLDVAGARRLLGDPVTIATALRARIHDETGLRASVGVATTKFLAKVASDLAKPDGLLVVAPGTEAEFLGPLPISRLWGVGPAIAKKLDRLGATTISDVAALPRDALIGAVGEAQGEHLHSLAHNRDEREVIPERAAKSVGHEETFPRDVFDRAVLDHELDRMATKVARRLRRAGLVTRTVTIKLRYPDFRTLTRTHTRPEPTDLAADLTAEAGALLDPLDISCGVRLLGLSTSKFEPAGDRQVDLFEAREPIEALERSLDAVRDRYGEDAVTGLAKKTRP